MFHVLDLKHYIAGRLLSPAWLGCQRCSWYLPPGWLSVAIRIAQSFIISCKAFIFVFLKGVRVNDHNDHNDQHTFDCEKETTCTVVRMQRLHAGVYLLKAPFTGTVLCACMHTRRGVRGGRAQLLLVNQLSC